MSQVLCESISEGLRESEVVAVFRDYYGRRHFLRVERDFLTPIGGKYWLPVGVVQIDSGKQVALIELPHEAETGANRLWIKLDQLKLSTEAVA